MDRLSVETRMIRTPVTGPEPCNTLVFLRCLVGWGERHLGFNNLVRDVIPVQTDFRIDGYQQAQYDWYLDNTQVSATCSLKVLETTTDLSFLFAVDRVEPVLSQLDGRLGFNVHLAAWGDDDALFAGSPEMGMTVTLTAYVLCFEPRAEAPPPSGSQRTPWATSITPVPRRGSIRALLGGS